MAARTLFYLIKRRNTTKMMPIKIISVFQIANCTKHTALTLMSV